MILVFVMPLGFGQWTIREDDTSRSLIAPEHWGFFIWNIPLIMYCCCCCCCWVASVVSNSVQPQRRQPTKLHRPWDSPGKNTGVGCHFLPQCMKVKSESEVAQSCPTLRDPLESSPPGSSVHGICRQEYSSVYSCYLFLISSASVRSLPFLSLFPWRDL